MNPVILGVRSLDETFETVRQVWRTGRRVHRDVKPVHADVQTLVRAGVLDKTEQGRAVFPYDTIHVDFTLKAA